MCEFEFIAPITGVINIKISAKTIEDAVDILLKKQSDLEQHPFGKLNLEIDKIVVIPNNSKTFN